MLACAGTLLWERGGSAWSVQKEWGLTCVLHAMSGVQMLWVASISITKQVQAL